MGVRFGVYEKTYSTDTEASISVVSAVCTVSAFIMPFVITLVQPLFIIDNTIGFFVGLATSLGCL